MPTAAGPPRTSPPGWTRHVGQERMPLLDQLEAYRKAAEAKAATDGA